MAKSKKEEKVYSKGVLDYVSEFERWQNELTKYHDERFDRNYRQYTAHTEIKGTKTQISDPVAPELIERIVVRLFEKDPKLFSVARGIKLPNRISDIMDSFVDFMWHNPDMISSTGVMKEKLKVVGREFCVTGNVGVESYYNADSDSPDMRHIPIEDVIFNPAKTLKTSDTYYIVQNVDIDYLEEHKQIMKDGKVVTGIFDNIDYIKSIYDGVKIKDEDNIHINRSGNDSITPKQGPIKLITRWKGQECCRFIHGLTENPDDRSIVQEFSNKVLGSNPLDFAMDIEVPKQPYAFSILDFINGITGAKDILLNQVIAYGSKVLNPPIFADPSISPINRRTLVNAFKIGGIVYANPQQVEQKQLPSMPSIGFDLMNYIQQRAEGATGIGAYIGGVPNQVSDKTQGTKGGIQMMMQQAVGPLRDKQMNIETSIIEPVINKWVKMIGATMSETDYKWVLIAGDTKEYVKATKGIITGKIKVKDLLTVGAITQEMATSMIKDMLLTGKNPDEEILYDVDWLIRCEAGSLAEVDMQTEKEAFREWVAFNVQFGVQLDMKKVAVEMAHKSKIKEPAQYFSETPPPGAGMPPGMGESGMPMGMTPNQQPAPQGMEKAGEIRKPPIRQVV